MYYYNDNGILKSKTKFYPESYILLLFYIAPTEKDNHFSEYINDVTLTHNIEESNCKIKTNDNILFYLCSTKNINTDETFLLYSDDKLYRKYYNLLKKYLEREKEKQK